MALFTQGQRIEVIVRKEDTSAATAGANEENPENAGTNSEKAEQTGGGGQAQDKNSKVFGRITATKVLSAGIMIGRLALNYYAGGVGYRNGDAAQQEAVQRNFEVIEEGAGLIASVGIGVTYGVRGGPVGMLIGGALALATTAISLGVKYAGKEREYNVKIFKEENAIEYKRARANLSLTTGRLR